MHTPLIEACADSYASCRAAWLGGADRLELCAHLVIGGTTPSTALFRLVQRDIPVKMLCEEDGTLEDVHVEVHDAEEEDEEDEQED